MTAARAKEAADRLPPSNEAAEQALLGALLCENRAFEQVAGIVQREDFATAVHGRIFAAIAKAIERGEAANPVTLRAAFDADPALTTLGGGLYLGRLAASAVTILNARDYARIIADLARRREVIEAAEALIGDARDFDLEKPTASLLADHARRIGEINLPPAGSAICDAGEDEAPIPPREWLLGNAFCRGFISGLVAQGGGSKTSLRIAQAMALASGHQITGEHIFQRARVLIVSLEDGIDELRRRVLAARLYHEIPISELAGHLFLWAPTRMKLAELQADSRAAVAGELERQIRREVTARKIDLVILDPLIKAHTVDENDNNGLDAVCCILADLARDLNIAADVAHHERKGTAAAGDAERGRGASSVKDAARLVYTLTAMSEAEREQFGVSEAERRSLIRLDSAKVNIAPPSIDAQWFRIVGVPLGNGTDLYPHGDTVPTVEPWQPPDMWAEISAAKANEILDQIDRGPAEGRRYSASNSAGEDRAAWCVVKRGCPGLTEKQGRLVVGIWLKNGVLENQPYDDPIDRKQRIGLVVKKRPG